MYQDVKSNTLGVAIRTVLALLDKIFYPILIFIFKIFFNVASVTLLSGPTIRQFYTRIQIVFGVFMLFVLTISLVQGIVSPDSISDKNKGFSKLITKVLISLVMLTLIIPINIPASALPENGYKSNGKLTQESYNAQINTNGILFGTLFFAQDVILSNNVLGRLILGSKTDEVLSDEDEDSLGNQFAAVILKGFVAINIKEEAESEEYAELKNDNRRCDNISKTYLKVYKSNNVRAILSMITDAKCEAVDTGKNIFAFSYIGFASSIAAVIFIVLLLNFCIQIAVRAVKLALLRLIAPIPILAYMNPNKKGDEIFNNWVSTTLTTFMDLFIRLAVVYFVIFIMADLMKNGVNVQTSNVVGMFSKVLIYIGLFMFAKEAPEFITGLFGIKSKGGFFSGLAAIAGAGAVLGGMAGSAAANVRASRNAGKKNVIGNAFSGFGGLLSGGLAGGAAAMSAKDHSASAAIKAMQQRNAIVASGSTARGRLSERASRMFTGQGRGEKLSKDMELYKTAIEKNKALKSMYEDEAVKSTESKGMLHALDSNGNAVAISGNYTSIMGELQNARDQGLSEAKIGNQTIALSSINDNNIQAFKDSNSEDYVNGLHAHRYKANKKVEGAEIEANYANKEAGLSNYTNISDFDTAKKAIGDSMNAARDISTNSSNQSLIANSNAVDKK